MSVQPHETTVADQAQAPIFQRVLLKLSGEALMGDQEYGIDAPTIAELAHEIAEVHAWGVEIAIVVGGGNIYRGLAAAADGMDRATADYAGMLATVLNSLAVQDALEKRGIQTRVLSALHVREVAEPYIRRRARWRSTASPASTTAIRARRHRRSSSPSSRTWKRSSGASR